MRVWGCCVLAAGFVLACNPRGDELPLGDPPAPIDEPEPEPEPEPESDPDAEPEPPPQEEEDSSGFIPTPDGGWDSPCDPWKQDCPVGEKCVPYVMTPGYCCYDNTKCVPVAEDPVEVGEPCEVEADYRYTGRDPCRRGALCWDVMDNDVGTCLALCKGDYGYGECPVGAQCSMDKDGIASICLPDCDPFEDACPPGCGCYWGVRGFSCRPDLSGEMGAAGDPCEGVQMCDSGLSCESADLVPGCEGGSCCTPYCDPESAEGCEPGLECQVDEWSKWIGVCAQSG